MATRAAEDEDYRLDCFGMVKAIVGQMARHSAKLTDTERGLIDRAVNMVWSERGPLRRSPASAKRWPVFGHDTASDLATALAPYMAGGTYGAFFEGQASLDLDTDFTVFEMSDLATREELRSVVLSAIMFMTSQAMTRSPRSVRKLLLIDEAWSMLKGGSMGEFVETYARTCRKYGGALATATQSLNDYYKSDGATAALENSDWMLILQQKPETIADFKASKRLDMDDRTETLIRSLKRSGQRLFRGLHQGAGDRSHRSARARRLFGNAVLELAPDLRRDRCRDRARPPACRCDRAHRLCQPLTPHPPRIPIHASPPRHPLRPGEGPVRRRTARQPARQRHGARACRRWLLHFASRLPFLGSSYLMALGLPLLFFLLLSGGDAGAFFAHLANLVTASWRPTSRRRDRLPRPVQVRPDRCRDARRRLAPAALHQRSRARILGRKAVKNIWQHLACAAAYMR
jgi:hypothetical protein